MAEMREISHLMPENGSRPNGRHGLRDGLGELSQAQSLAPAENHNLHGRLTRSSVLLVESADDPRLRDRDEEAGAPFASVLQLADDFLRQVPRQDPDQVRPRF